MSVFLDRIDTVPLQSTDFNFDFYQWLSALVDTLNETFDEIEQQLNRYDNGLIAPSFTAAEIAVLAVDSVNGTLWYDTTNNQLKAKVNNVVVVLA